VVAPDETVTPRRVTLGEWAGDGWVVLDGLSPGERVVTDGMLSVRPGMPVKVGADAPAAGARAATAPVAASAR
jgi:multidrug efflux pump subunit AcrA (membrane-fusion protein)